MQSRRSTLDETAERVAIAATKARSDVAQRLTKRRYSVVRVSVDVVGRLEPWPVKLSRLSGSVRHCQGDYQAFVKASVKIHCQHCQASVTPLSSDLDSDHVPHLSRLSSRPLSDCQGCQALSGHAYPCRAGS